MTEEYPSFDKPPFVRKHLETQTDIVNVRLNEQERSELQLIKKLLQLEGDSTALKTGLSIALNVLQNTFGEPLLAYICSQRRVRPRQ